MKRWTSMLGNYCKRQRKDQLLHTLPGFEASALAYRFSETGDRRLPTCSVVCERI